MPSGRPKKTVRDYECEANLVNGCLIHPVAHVARHVYQLRHGKLSSSSIFVCHTCDTPQCTLDAHHFLGTNADNMADMARKGRKKAAMNRPEVKALQSLVQRKRLEDPTAYAQLLRVRRRTETREKIRQGVTASWKNPEQRAVKLRALKLAHNKPEMLQKKSDVMRAYYSVSENRVRASNIQQALKKRPEVIANHRKGAKAMWARPEYRAKHVNLQSHSSEVL